MRFPQSVIILCILGASLLGNLLSNKSTIRAGKSTIIAGQNFNAFSSFSSFWNTKVASKWI